MKNIKAPVAQWIERLFPKQKVVGSTPTWRVHFYPIFLLTSHFASDETRKEWEKKEAAETDIFKYLNTITKSNGAQFISVSYQAFSRLSSLMSLSRSPPSFFSKIE
jgi:hypothetical protein